ncbi:MAG: chorismate synthase, partial [Candidatus Omnitrophota bacterium]
MLRFLTAGESHGEAVISILEGMVAGLRVDTGSIDTQLKRRMQGYGRGDRMKIENDTVRILSGLKDGSTLASPITMMVKNKDASIDTLPPLSCPRPGHADLAGGLKYNQKDMRTILERSSARETVARVSVGSICKLFLSELGIEVISHVKVIGGVDCHTRDLSYEQVRDQAEKSKTRCADGAATKLMVEEIDGAKESGDTLGGCFEVIARGVPAGLGSHTHWDRKLDANIARALMSIQAIKGVSVGIGMGAAIKRGSKCHDEIIYKKGHGFLRRTN